MKIKIFAILAAYLLIFPAFAAEDEYLYMPSEYIGYIEYQSTDSIGRTVTIKQPVRYTKEAKRDYSTYESNAVRDCRLELERAKEQNERRQYSAKYYPLYYYQ